MDNGQPSGGDVNARNGLGLEMSVERISSTRPPRAHGLGRWARRLFQRGWVDFAALIVALFVLDAWPTPGINEAHYLLKAKHFWRPDFLPHDFFLASRDAHVGFFWLVGWLTLVLPLWAAAWVGRLAGWSLLAWGWMRLCRAYLTGDASPRRRRRIVGIPLVAGIGFFSLTLQCHMAGEWVLGGVEGKVFAFGLVFLALAAVAENRWNRAWIGIGAASLMHVLVGGWSAVALGFAWLAANAFARVRLKERPKPSMAPPLPLRMLPGLVIGAALAALAVIPALWLNHGVEEAVARDAAETYVYFRLPHHLTLSGFPLHRIVRFAGLFVGLLVAYALVPAAARQWRVRAFIFGSLLIAGAGAIIEAATWGRPEVAAPLLRFYWYRLSDIIVPLGVALETAALLRTAPVLRPKWAPVVATVVMLATAGLFAASLWNRNQAWYADSYFPRARTRHERWVLANRWIAENTPPGATFLTPWRQQTFKWYSGRAEVFNFKDVPQDAAGVVAWRRRFDDIFLRDADDLRRARLRRRQDLEAEAEEAGAGATLIHPEDLVVSRWRRSLAEIDTQDMRRLARKYGFEYVVFDRRFIRHQRPRSVKSLKKVYPVFPAVNEYYAVYQVRPEVFEKGDDGK